MPKRRRERDKPKSGPESLYNPNKRVLLSYASDEEEAAAAVDDGLEQTSVNGAEVAIDDRTLANYQMTEYPDSEEDTVVGVAADGPVGAFARESEDAQEDVEDVAEIEDDEDEEEEEEEEEISSAARDKTTHERGPPIKRDPKTHQWPTLGPVSYGGDDDEEYDPETEEALAYLEAVKIERYAIPEILSAPRPLQADADHLQDSTFTNHDEIRLEGDEGESTDASIKIEPLTSDLTPAGDDATNPQRVFTRLLLERFMEQRQQLHIPPSMNKLTELPDSCPISFPRGNNKAFAEWCRLLSTKAPLPAQLRSMDQNTIFNLLGLVQKHFLAKNCQLSKVISAWIWSLLARLDDVGTMNNDKVFPLRELGKQVVFLLLSFTSPELAAGVEGLGREAPSVASAKTDGTEQSALTTPPTENTLATLDMMLVVIGEAFGQKDLLEFRPTWTATEKTV